MKPRFHYLILFLLAACATGPGPSSSRPTFESIATDYFNAVTVETKRDICINAIDRGLIVPGIRLETLKGMFREDFAIQSTNSDGSGNGLVLFLRHPKVPSPDFVQAAPPTWRLIFNYDANFEITYYYLSNTGLTPNKAMGAPLDRAQSNINVQLPAPDKKRRE